MKWKELGKDKKTIEKTEDVMSGMSVYTFNVKTRAEEAARSFNKDYLELQKGKGDCRDAKNVNARGEARNVGADSRGYAVLVIKHTQKDTAFVFPLEKYYDMEKNLVTYEQIVELADQQMGEVEKVARRKGDKPEPPKARARGKTLTFDGEVELDTAYTRNDARYVFAPRLIMVEDEHLGKKRKDSVVICHFPPYVFDALPYEKTQLRRMQFDSSRDKLDEYKINRRKDITGEDSVFMEERGRYRFKYHAVYEPRELGKGYVSRKHEWYEDYRKVYREDRNEDPTEPWWDGKIQEPLFFLDWSGVQSIVSIDPLKYPKELKTITLNDTKQVKLEFEVGKTTLDMSDSLTRTGLDVLYRMLERWYNDPNAEVRDVHVSGYASPEGTFATNVRLAQDRSSELIRLLRAQSGSGKVRQWHNDNLEEKNKGFVVEWNEVADSLEKRYNTPEAQEAAAGIRAITEVTEDRDAQQRQILSAAWYPMVKETALKMVRRVVVRVEYVAQRELTPDEIYEKYVNDTPKGYHQGIGLGDYEYFHLMNRLYDEEHWSELRVIAQAAYDNIEVTGEPAKRTTLMEDTTATNPDDRFYLKADEKPFDRHYALAAYYLSCCMLKAGDTDSTAVHLLEEFLDDERKEIKKRELGDRWNDPAIVVNHILLNCYAQDFKRAEYYALYWLPTESNAPNDPNLQAYSNMRKLIAFLNGDEDPQAMEYIKSTSGLNAAVVYLDRENWKEALAILNDSSRTDQGDAKVHYMKAICRYQMLDELQRKHAREYYDSYFIYDPRPDDDNPRDIAAPMLEALRLNPELEKHLDNDGYFNNAYRRLVKYFWHRIRKEGENADMDVIREEYDKLIAKYVKKATS